jgi:hypothetical protein
MRLQDLVSHLPLPSLARQADTGVFSPNNKDKGKENDAAAELDRMVIDHDLVQITGHELFTIRLCTNTSSESHEKSTTTPFAHNTQTVIEQPRNTSS